MFKRLFHCFIALILVCSLMLHAMTPRAKAFDLTGAILYNIAGNIGVNAALRAIGVGPGNSPEAFNNLVNDIANSEIVNTAGQILIAGTAGDYKGFLQKSFLQSILDYMFDSGTLSVPEGISQHEAGASFSLGGYSFTCTLPCVAFASKLSGLGGMTLFVCSLGYSQPTISTSLDMSYYGAIDVSGQAYIVNSAYVSSYSGPYFAASSNNKGTTAKNCISGSATLMNASVTASEDLSLGTVASSVDSSLYDSWTANGGTYDGGDYIPVSIPSLTPSAIASQTQAQAQAGTIPDAVVEEIVAGSEAVPDTDTGTIAGVIEAIQALPQTLADNFTGVKEAVLSIPQAIADVFTPAQDITFYQLDLKSLFPFCIPFDIYSMLAALAADPVAPSFEFELDLGPVGLLPISADFSDWDDAAAFLRTCETLVFAVALAVKTKDLIGW